MFSLLGLLVIFYSALVLLVLRKWEIKGFAAYFVVILGIMILITLLWNFAGGHSFMPSPAHLVTLLIVYFFMLFMGSGTALLFHLIEDNETERQYTLMISGLSAFFGGVSFLPSMLLYVGLSCFIENACI